MILRTFTILMLFGCCFAQDDELAKALKADFIDEWRNRPDICVNALQYKGEGKEDYALKILSRGAQSDEARERYKIAASRPKDEFWEQFVAAGAAPVAYDRAGMPVPFDCRTNLTQVLQAHLAARPQDLGKASSDYEKDKFLALSDLLRATGVLRGYPELYRQDSYRYCFADPVDLFKTIKRMLGQK
jgi:hypothetical protein